MGAAITHTLPTTTAEAILGAAIAVLETTAHMMGAEVVCVTAIRVQLITQTSILMQQQEHVRRSLQLHQLLLLLLRPRPRHPSRPRLRRAARATRTIATRKRVAYATSATVHAVDTSVAASQDTNVSQAAAAITSATPAS